MCDNDTLAARAERFLVQCGPCDGGLPMGCACPTDDPRPLIAALLTEAEAGWALQAGIEALVYDSVHADFTPHPETDDDTVLAVRAIDLVHLLAGGSDA